MCKLKKKCLAVFFCKKTISSGENFWSHLCEYGHHLKFNVRLKVIEDSSVAKTQMFPPFQSEKRHDLRGCYKSGNICGCTSEKMIAQNFTFDSQCLPQAAWNAASRLLHLTLYFHSYQSYKVKYE